MRRLFALCKFRHRYACFGAANQKILRYMSRVATVDQMRFPMAVRALNTCGVLLDGAVIRHGRAGSFIEAAKRRCRLEDFGEGDFSEPLARLLDSCHKDAELNLVGKFALRSDITQQLCNRLFIERDRTSDPGIAREKIRQPLFIVGLPRTGTTLLHSLLAADPRHRAPLTWEIMEPAARNDNERSRQLRRAEKNMRWLNWLAPDFCRVHATGARLPQECVSLMGPSFLSDQFDTMFNIPSYRSWFLRQDFSPAYQFHRRFLQHLQHGSQPRRWILKAPAHMFALPALLSVYPDAIFVQAHRPPLQAVASVSSLITILRSIFSNKVDAREIGAEALRYWSETLNRFMQQRDRILHRRVCDLLYRDLQRDPLAAIAHVYDHFDWKLSGEIVSRMRMILARQPQELRSFHRYYADQFGFRLEDEAELFESYCQRFDLSTGKDCPSERHREIPSRYVSLKSDRSK
jgi:Sulfotransferase family